MKYAYPASFQQQDGKVLVTVPDLPGCQACGESIAEAICLAQDAIETWLNEAESGGKAIPSPSSLESVGFGPDPAAWERLFARSE